MRLIVNQFKKSGEVGLRTAVRRATTLPARWATLAVGEQVVSLAAAHTDTARCSGCGSYSNVQYEPKA